MEDLSNVKLVEIEIFSKCNRKCKWCPNSFIDRETKNNYLDENIFLQLLNDLKKYNFNGVITFSRYNEPMLDIETLKLRTNQVKEILPNTKVVFNTNGDYFNVENLVGLNADEITVMDYDNKGILYWSKKLKSLDSFYRIKEEYPFLLYSSIDINKILIYCDWTKNATIGNRGGSLNIKCEKRTLPCMEPTYFIGIDYNGNVMPCCELRSDNPNHEQYILGNLFDNNINEIYHSEKATIFRNKLKNFNPKNIPDCCKYCNKKPGRYTRTDNNEQILYEKKHYDFVFTDEEIDYLEKFLLNHENMKFRSLLQRYKTTAYKNKFINENPDIIYAVSIAKEYFLKNKEFFEREKKLRK